MGEPAFQLDPEDESLNGSPLAEALGGLEEDQGSSSEESSRARMLLTENPNPTPSPAKKPALQMEDGGLATPVENGGFPEGTPESVALQPNTRQNQPPAPKAEIPGPTVLNPKARVGSQQLNKAPETAQPNPANARETAKSNVKKTKDLASAGKEAAGGNFGALSAIAIQKALGNSKLGKRLSGLASDITNLYTLAWWPLLKKYWPVLVTIGMGCCLGCLMIGLVLATILAPQGNAAAGVAPGQTYAGATCAQMSPTLTTQDSQGNKTYTLTLASTTGQYSVEDNLQSLADPNPGYLFPGPGVATGQIALWPDLVKYDSSEVSTQAAAQWYMTADWDYTATTFTGGQGKAEAKTSFPGLPPATAFAGRKVIIYDPTTNKGVVGFVGDWGPNPSEAFSSNSDTYNAQQTLWNTTPENRGSTHYRITDPTGYKGRIAGGGTAVTKALGNPDGSSTIQLGFAADQSMPLGAFTCTVVQNGNRGTGSVTQPLGVPLVNEGSGGECGTASVYAVILYYNPAYLQQFPTDTSISKNSNGSYTVTPKTCAKLSSAMINQSSGGNATNFTSATLTTSTGTGSTQFVTWSTIEQSVTSGDPVIMYTAPDPFYNTSGSLDQHIVVITGYNASAGTFDIMSPNSTAQSLNGTFGSAAPAGASAPITPAILQKYLNYNNGSEQFIIRSTYLAAGA